MTDLHTLHILMGWTVDKTLSLLLCIRALQNMRCAVLLMVMVSVTYLLPLWNCFYNSPLHIISCEAWLYLCYLGLDSTLLRSIKMVLFPNYLSLEKNSKQNIFLQKKIIIMEFFVIIDVNVKKISTSSLPFLSPNIPHLN